MDNCEAIDLVLRKGVVGEIYNIGADNEEENIAITRMILDELGKPKDLIKYVKDRLGHDRRYALDCSKIKKLGWAPTTQLKEGLSQTIRWYYNNQEWWKKLVLA